MFDVLYNLTILLTANMIAGLVIGFAIVKSKHTLKRLGNYQIYLSKREQRFLMYGGVIGILVIEISNWRMNNHV